MKLRSYTFRVFVSVEEKHESGCSIHTSAGICDGKTCRSAGHRELGTYDDLDEPPWVPPVGSFFRFLDSYPPNKETNHAEAKGRVEDVVTLFYGTNTTIEVYLKPA